MPKRRIAPAIKQIVIREYLKNKTSYEIADMVGIHRVTVNSILRRHNIPQFRKDNRFVRKEVALETLKEIWAEHKTGTSYRALALKYGFSIITIKARLTEAKLYRAKKYAPRDYENDPNYVQFYTRVINGEEQKVVMLNQNQKKEVCELYRDTEITKQELTKKYDVSLTVIEAILRSNKIFTKRFVPEEIIDLFCDDFTQANGALNEYDLADVYKIHPATVRVWLIKRGVMLNGKVASTGELVAKHHTGANSTIKQMAKESLVDVVKYWKDLLIDPDVSADDKKWASLRLAEYGEGKPVAILPNADDVNVSKIDSIKKIIPQGKLDLIINNSTKKLG